MNIIVLLVLIFTAATIVSTALQDVNILQEMKPSQLIRKIPQVKLGVSEPPPSWFGNKENEQGNPRWTNENWLKSRFHFSFAEYRNPRNMGFGILRVMNDDLVQPDRGFGAHPHREVEICTYVVKGKLTHKDSMGTSETLGRGAIQFMTAGTGVTHSEHNLDKNDPLRFVQIWINTRTHGLKPNYGSMEGGNCAARTNQWSHLVSDVKDETPTAVKINQDANIHVTEVMPGQSVDFELKAGRQAYLLCVEGDAHLKMTAADATAGSGSGLEEEQQLQQHDSAEVFGPSTLTIAPLDSSATTNESTPGAAHVLLVEMAYTGVGRTDL
mmetsp:Transcript_2186/g.3439  ORF Transcript_2186/g.3439 Transcript_2186/m.3439 type:complete len:326 (+) Transcript_2186:63-1040(+)